MTFLYKQNLLIDSNFIHKNKYYFYYSLSQTKKKVCPLLLTFNSMLLNTV